ncbi:glycosyltransferase [Vibrio owensii]|uniref:glycosyltransferase n=1 Tax=Vibrio owensii TaxID=696485 RepID=UPI000597BD72|nr:glycosyltransferase [Vibrio owensii]
MGCNPCVAVIMSVYKNDDISQLQESIFSLFSQSYSNIHVFICIDGEVSQEINDFLIGLSNERSDFIVYKNPCNKGLAFSLNRLVDCVLKSGGNYEYIARMDSDDISLPHRISEQVYFMECNKEVDVSGGYCKEFGSTYSLEVKKVPLNHSDLVYHSLSRCPFIHPTVIFRVKVFSDGMRYPENTVLTEDMAFWLELIREGYTFSNIPDVILKYRMNEDLVERRLGLDKGFSEFRVRINHYFSSGERAIKPLLLITGRLFFHSLPVGVIKVLYKYMR